jgi:hypothetical protein
MATQQEMLIRLQKPPGQSGGAKRSLISAK